MANDFFNPNNLYYNWLTQGIEPDIIPSTGILPPPGQDPSQFAPGGDPFTNLLNQYLNDPSGFLTQSVGVATQGNPNPFGGGFDPYAGPSDPLGPASGNPLNTGVDPTGSGIPTSGITPTSFDPQDPISINVLAEPPSGIYYPPGSPQNPTGTTPQGVAGPDAGGGVPNLNVPFGGGSPFNPGTSGPGPLNQNPFDTGQIPISFPFGVNPQGQPVNAYGTPYSQPQSVPAPQGGSGPVDQGGPGMLPNSYAMALGLHPFLLPFQQANPSYNMEMKMQNQMGPAAYKAMLLAAMYRNMAAHSQGDTTHIPGGGEVSRGVPQSKGA